MSSTGMLLWVSCLMSLTQICQANFIVSPDVSDPCASAATQQHEGDIAYFTSPNASSNHTSQDGKRRKRAATSLSSLLWPDGDIYYTFSDQFTDSEEEQVIDAMRHWEEHTCLRFHKRTTEPNYVNFFQGSGCCSYVGRLGYGLQGISLSKRCLRFPTILHEIGHAIGFWHEHTRPDRDEYVEILHENIEDRYAKNFKKLDSSAVDSQGIGYDYNSIMHYNSDFFAIYSGLDTIRAWEANIPIGQAAALSPMDIEQTNRLYASECGNTTTRPSSLPPAVQTTPPPLPYPCGAIISDTANASFSSPSSPAPHSVSTDCGWLVKPAGNFLIYVDLKSVSLESSAGCAVEYIQVFEGTDETGISRALLCGQHQTYPPIVVGTGRVFVRFHSTKLLQRGSFHAEVRFADLNECFGGASCTHFCRNTYGGHECYCQDGYYLSADGRTCFDINECGVNYGGCHDICVNTGGSYYCSCSSGQILQPDMVSCRPPGASCSFHNGGCHHNCTETADSRVCSCLSGYNLEPDGHTCHDIDECYSSHPCSHKCVNTLGSYRCKCNVGYHLLSDNHTCVPDRVCSVNNGGCSQNCLDGQGGTAVCYCKKGYRLGPDQLTCEDINECAEQARLCDQVCINTNGSYMCKCHPGYALDYDLRNCLNVNECQLQIDECQFSSYCQDTYGSYYCGCPTGYYLANDRITCYDLDECELGYNYLCSHGCRNLPGTYECTCEEGYVLQSSWLCLDEDECVFNTHQCDVFSEASCVNTVGSYVCLCPHGLKLDSTGRICEDIDECAEGLHSCASGLYCVNVFGYYTCSETPPPTTPPTPSSATTPLNALTPQPQQSHSGITEEYSETNSEPHSGTTESHSGTTESYPGTIKSHSGITEPHSETTESYSGTTEYHSGTAPHTPTLSTMGTGSETTVSHSETDSEAESTNSYSQSGSEPTEMHSTSNSETTRSHSGTDSETATESTPDSGPTESYSETATESPHSKPTESHSGTGLEPTTLTTPTSDSTSMNPSTPTEEPTDVTTAIDVTVPPTEYQCGGLITSDAGSIRSENWPQTYPVNVDCEWTISLPNTDLILQISFSKDPFGLAGRMPKCKKDWVKVESLDANETVLTTWGPFCEFAVPPSILIASSTARIQFHSGSKHGSSRKGFRLHYEALEVCASIPPPLNVQGTFGCNSVIQANEKFGPPEFPNYLTDQTSISCRWVYYGGPPARLRLLYFDLPESQDCSENSLRLYRGISVSDANLLMPPLCGRLEGEGRVVEMNTTYFTIQLRVSSRDGSFRGIHAVMEPT